MNEGVMSSSARVALYDAVGLFSTGKAEAARRRALHSLAYSVGVFHASYKAVQDANIAQARKA